MLRIGWALLLEMLSEGKPNQEKSKGSHAGFIFKLYSLRVPIYESYGEISGGAYNGKLIATT
jgi:hypothetical protein